VRSVEGKQKLNKAKKKKKSIPVTESYLNGATFI